LATYLQLEVVGEKLQHFSTATCSYCHDINRSITAWQNERSIVQRR